MTHDDMTGALRPVSPMPSIDAVIAAHGARKVLAAAIAAFWRGRVGKARPPDRFRLPHAVSDHMLRDIGLDPPSRIDYRGLP